MKDNILFRGIMPALITPLNDDSTVRTQAVEPLVKWMISQGVDGFYVLGGTGEGGVLAEKERMAMAEAAAQAIKGTGKKLILHVGAADTHSAKRLARHAAQVGADAISSVYPNFFCRYDMDEAADYYQALVDASGLPMLGYCQALMQGANVLTFVERLMQVPGVIGVKYTFPDYYQLQRIKRLNGGNINVINGPDESLLCGLAMGADGGIGTTYNLMPGWFARLYERFRANDVQGAQELQFKINQVIDVLLFTHLIPAVRVALEEMGFDPGFAAEPAHRFTVQERKELVEALHAAGLFD